MRPRFCPYYLVCIFLFGLFGLHSFAADKRKTKEPAKTTKEKVAKADAKKSEKNVRDARKEKSSSKDLAKNKQPEKNAKDKKGKATDKETAKNRNDKSRSKETAKVTKQENSKKSAKELAQKTEKTKATDSAKKKTESIAQKTPAKEKLKQLAEKSEPKHDSNSDNKVKSEKSAKGTKEDSTLLAKTVANAAVKARDHDRNERSYQSKTDESVRQLPLTKFVIRPVTKITPKVELKFSLAKALAPSFDPPPPAAPRGPDVIEVIEHDSPENRKLDDMYRQEVKSLSLSAIPNVSSKKIDIKKMDNERIAQIQEALQKRSYYAGAITGVYDDATVEAMRQFQMAHKIDVTGYATAHTLKLLGLTDWEQRYE